MANIFLLSGKYCNGEQIALGVQSKLNYKSLDQKLVDYTSNKFNINHKNLIRAIKGPEFIFNKFNHKKEKYLACLKVGLAELIKENDLVYHGYATLLAPSNVTHFLKVCVLADAEYRISKVKEKKGINDREASRIVREKDEKLFEWAKYLHDCSPWDKSLYDIKIPVNQSSVDEAIDLICEHATRSLLLPTDVSMSAVEDFRIASEVNLKLTESNHFHNVECHNKVATISIDEYSLRLEKLEDELRSIASKVDGIEEVITKAGKNFRPSSMFANMELDLPQKVLLVDDEKDFVMTLSERLQLRDLEPAIAHDGEHALSILEEEVPEVMILDLKMPGIDGIEVLKNVKASHPAVEVIILTGHGSEKDRKLCMDLGAFAYLEKPVDIEDLSKAMKDANEKIKMREKHNNVIYKRGANEDICETHKQVDIF